MDFQQIADSISAMTCVVSVEKRADGYGDIRIVTGNRAYIDSIEKPVGGAQMLSTEFVPNSLYTRYLTRDLNFEDYCYRAAVQKKCLHSYAHPERLDVWFNMTFLPLEADDGDLCYCTYTMEINLEADSERLSNISGELASEILAMSIKLNHAEDFVAAVQDVIKDIRELCNAERCCVLLTDAQKRTCPAIWRDAAPHVVGPPIESFNGDSFYEIAESWRGTIAGSNCLVAKNEHDMEVVRERNPLWYESLKSYGVDTIALFPLKAHNTLVGYIWATNFDPEDAAKIKEILELATVVLGAEIGTYRLVDMLTMLSSRDGLTGTQNRNELDNVLEELSAGKGDHRGSIGVIFADLNGLKETNDAEGHAAGDRLLESAAETLREVFADREIFRAGGDEFAVILTGVTAEELDQKVLELRRAVQANSEVTFAIGSGFDDDCRNVRQALLCADRRMYEDKRAYYGQHPGKKRD